MRGCGHHGGKSWRNGRGVGGWRILGSTDNARKGEEWSNVPDDSICIDVGNKVTRACYYLDRLFISLASLNFDLSPYLKKLCRRSTVALSAKTEKGPFFIRPLIYTI